MKIKRITAVLLFIIVCAVAAVAIAFLRPYKPTSFVVDGDIFSAAVEDGATLILDLDNDSNRKKWSIIQSPEHLQCFVKDYVTVTENITEFHMIATDDGKDVMIFQSVSDDGTTENYELELTISRHKKSCLQIDTVSFVKTESGIEAKADMAEDKTDTEQAAAVVPSVMIHGVLYQDTGYISSAIGCGNMDGEIISAVDSSELPTKDDQSNFGTGYQYQLSSEGQIIVVVDANRKIFRDPNHEFASDMPGEVLNFRAEVVEDRGKGNYLVSVIDVPDLFKFPSEGVYVIVTNEINLKDEITVGDTVRVWFDSLVQEIYPPILPNVYRVVKEKQEAGVSEIISFNDDFKAEAYHQNEDGSWCYMGRNYQYRLMLTGTLPNAAADSFYVVLSDYDDITFEDAANFLLSGTRDPDEENRFVIANLGVYTPECEVESAKVVVSAVEAVPTGITVCFDQYDNTVQSELLTGEYFVLEKKDGDQWTEVEPVIENAAFTAVGIVLQKGVITRKTFDWEWLYGRQEPGQYRIRVQVVDNTAHEAAAEFTIPE